MRKIFGAIILFLLCINLVFAGETYNLDFSKQDEFLVGLKEGDRIEFNLKDERNTIILTKIRNESVETRSYIALNTRNVPYYFDLKKGNKIVFDVDNDGAKDVEIKLYKIENEVAALYLNKLEGSLWPAGNVVADTNIEKIKRYGREYDVIVIGFLGLIGVVMVVLILKKYKFKEKNEEKIG